MEEKKKSKKSVKETVKDVEIREVIVEKKVGFNYAEVIVIMIITLLIGGMIGSFISFVGDNKNKQNNNNEEVISEIPSSMNEFLKTYKNILNEYYEDIDEKELLEAGINGMLEYLGDDYSVYMDKDASKSFNEQVDGKYKGKPGWQKKLASAYIAGKSAIQGGKDGAKSGKILSAYANRDKAYIKNSRFIFC